MEFLILAAALVMVWISWLMSVKTEMHYKGALDLRDRLVEQRDSLLAQEANLKEAALRMATTFNADKNRAKEIVAEMARIDADFRKNQQALLQAIVASAKKGR